MGLYYVLGRTSREDDEGERFSLPLTSDERDDIVSVVDGVVIIHLPLLSQGN